MKINAKIINNLDDEELLCGICHDEIDVADRVFIFKCGHFFHLKCIKWSLK
jgi:hypothetical protein